MLMLQEDLVQPFMVEETKLEQEVQMLILRLQQQQMSSEEEMLLE